MDKLLTITLCLFTSMLAAQTSKLKIEFSSTEDTWYTLYLLKESDTIHTASVPYDLDYPIFLDSLEAGLYKIHMYDVSDKDEYVVARSFLLEEEKTTSVSIHYYFSENQSINTIEGEVEEIEPSDLIKAEFQVHFGYFNSRWIDPNSIIKNNFSFGYSTFGWNTFSKHVGFLYGGGLGFSQHYFDKNITLFDDSTTSRKAERYASVNLNCEMKFRFSTGNQQNPELNSAKLFMDIGAGYYLPIVFNHTAVYEGNRKMIEKRIHRFNDFRAFVCIGFAPVNLFFEYRLSNFVKGGNPQLPRYNAGIRIVIPMEE